MNKNRNGNMNIKLIRKISVTMLLFYPFIVFPATIAVINNISVNGNLYDATIFDNYTETYAGNPVHTAVFAMDANTVLRDILNANASYDVGSSFYHTACSGIASCFLITRPIAGDTTPYVWANAINDWTTGTVPGLSTFQDSNWNYVQWDEVSAVPLPAAAWLFGSGLLGLIGMARRKKA